jgi:Nucleotidyltransferase domain
VSPPVSDFLDSLRDWAAHQPTIAGVALVGSYARGEARPDSDIDVVLLCEEPHAFLAHAPWIHHLGLDEGDRRSVQSPPASGTGGHSHSVSRVTMCADRRDLHPLIPDGILFMCPFSLGSFVDLPRCSRVSFGVGHIYCDVRYRTRYAPHAGSSCFSPCHGIACVNNARVDDLIEGSVVGSSRAPNRLQTTIT